MFTVALTGGIGSGKTAASDTFAELGADVIDTDCIAREVVSPGTEALRHISTHFGPDILLNDGQLNRRALREKVFNDKAEKKWLEALLHPLIFQAVQERIQLSSGPYCILVIPLLFETNNNYQYDRVLVIDVPDNLQRDRAMARDHMTSKTFEAIKKTQVDRKTRLAKADDVILNDKDLIHLQSQVKKRHKTYLELAN